MPLVHRMDYIEQFQIENFQCIQSLDLRLTPLHALIGPNDSGKSTILKAIRIMMALGSGRLKVENGVGYPVNPEFLSPIYTLRLKLSGQKYSVRLDAGSTLSPGLPQNLINLPQRILLGAEGKTVGRWWAQHHNLHENTFSESSPLVFKSNESSLNATDWTRPTAFLNGDARFIHPSPEAMRQPSQLHNHGNELDLLDERGAGLAAVLDRILSTDVEKYIELNAKLRTLFPDVKSLSLPLVADGTKELRVKLMDGREIPARNLSEGFLYYTLFSALPLLSPRSILLVEEPENGLHPARISEVMRILREISKSTQVLIATHSPLVINELQPEEVTLITRPEGRGTVATPMTRTQNFEERSKVYALGELWLSYADGNQESRLVPNGGEAGAAKGTAV